MDNAIWATQENARSRPVWFFLRTSDLAYHMNLLYERISLNVHPRARARSHALLSGASFMADQIALITGASSGIGLSLSKELASRGFDLIICSAGNRLEPAADDLQHLGVQVTVIQEDLAMRDGIDALWSKTLALGRPIDVACINAGVGVGGLFVETDLDEELDMVALNCAGTIHLAKHVTQHMQELGAGNILFTASIAGEMVAPREAVYAATKAFVLSFAQSLRYELRDTGINVTALQPGPTDTKFFHRAGMDDTEVGSEGLHESEPDDVAKQGLEALFAGKDHVYSASLKTKMEGMLANVVPGP
jgi:short-subunit dehydrogenase